MTSLGAAYRGRRVLLTGHTGFKGSWLASWLSALGAHVTGLSLPASTTPNHWSLLGVALDERLVDLRDADAVRAVVADARPEAVFHLAAQPLVRRSYADPIETWSTNVMGTANLLDACRGAGGVRAIVVVTTDKCYENREWPWGYRERDRLGGHDPYSASKAATELLCASFRDAFYAPGGTPLLATARAGNVIGGGDWSDDRLVPDLVRALTARRSLEVRSPKATRPWQHVLDSLAGYLLLGQRLLAGDASAARAWNFGPDREGNRRVEDVLAALSRAWPDLAWHASTAAHPHETQLLHLDSSQAREALGWRPVWTLDEALERTAAWYRAHAEHGGVLTDAQIAAFVEAARASGHAWAGA